MKNNQTNFLKLCLADSLLKCMNKKDYKNISITDICDGALIGRTTFYRHLSKQNPKEELLKFKIIFGWEEYKAHQAENEDNNHNLLIYIYSIRKIILLLIDNDLLNVVMDSIQEIIVPNLGEDRNTSYILSFLSYGFFGIIFQWIKYRFDEVPEEVEKRINNIIKNKTPNQ